MNGLCLSWLNRLNDSVGSGRTECTFVCWCTFFQGVIQCTVIISSVFVLKINCNDNGLLLLDATISSALDKSLYVLDFEAVIWIFLLHPAWSDHLTLTLYHNILPWRWSGCVYLGWIDWMISFILDEQLVRLYYCALDFARVIDCQNFIIVRCHNTTITTAGVRLSWLNV